MLKPRTARLAQFGALYVAQGGALGYFLTFNILYLRAQGLGAADIGIFQATLVLPFILKILLGMLSDRFSLFGLGHRSPYILLGLLLQVGCFGWLPLIALPDGLGTFFAVSMLAAASMALYDTCTDGLAVEKTPAHERALVQGVMVGARAAGILIALLAGGWLADHGGWAAVFHLVAVLSLPAVLLSLVFWDRDGRRPAGAFGWAAFRVLGRREVMVVALMGVIFTLALDGVLSFLSFHRDASGVTDIGALSGLVAISMVGRIGGALVSGRLTDHLGHRRSVRFAVLLSAFACLGLALQLGAGALALVCLVFGFAYGYYQAVYAAMAMTLTDPRIAASMFAIFMMFLNIGVAAGQGLGGLITESLGFAGLAVLMSLVGLFNLLLVRQLSAPAGGAGGP